MGMSNVELRKETKKAALKILKAGNEDMSILASRLSEFNGWKKHTNWLILQELLDVGSIEKRGGVVYLTK